MKIFKREPSLKEKLSNVLALVKNHHSRLLFIKQKLKSRESILFEKLKLTHQNEMAKILANEIAEIRRLQNNIDNIILALESFILRAETILSLDEFAKAISPIPRVITSIKEEASKVSPILSSEMDELVNNIENLKIYYPENNVYEISMNEEAEAILKEAAEIASSNIAKKLPEIPLANQEKKLTSLRLMEAEGYGTEYAAMKHNSSEVTSLEDKLLRYVIENKGKIDLKRCSEELGVSQSKLNQVIDDLIKQGKLQRIK